MLGPKKFEFLKLILKPVHNKKPRCQKIMAFTFGLIATLMISSSSFAQFKTLGQTDLQIKSNKIQVVVKKGFHFNVDAPAYLKVEDQKIEPLEKTLQKMTFPKKEKALVSFYVCDDKNTVCEMHQEVVGVAQKNQPKTFGAKLNSISLQDALDRAKTEKKLVFVDFFAAWCPPCIRLEKEVLHKKKFKELTEKLIFVSLDIDQEENFKWMDQYQVKAFPTLILMDTTGNEITRWVDFIPEEKLVSQVTEFIGKDNLQISELEKKAQAGDLEKAFQLAENKYKALLYQESLPWYEKSQKLNFHYYDALIETNKAQFEAKKITLPDLINAYEKALKAFPENYYSVGWILNLSQILEKEKKDFKPWLDQGMKLAQKMIDDPMMIKKFQQQGELSEIQGLEISELYYKLSEFSELNKDLKARDQYLQKATDTILAQQPNIKNPMQMIYFIHYQKKIKTPAQIEPLYEKLQKAYPNDQTYLHRHARYLADQKLFEKALPISLKSYSMAQGRVKIQAGLLVHEILQNLNKKEEATKMLSELKNNPILKNEKLAKLKKQVDQL